jgi:hypothetical protein
MAFQTLRLAEMCSWCEICFIFLENLRLKTPVVLINIHHILLAMRVRTKVSIVNSFIDVRL